MLRISAERTFRSARGARFDWVAVSQWYRREHGWTFRAHCPSNFVWSSRSLTGTPQVPDRRSGHSMFWTFSLTTSRRTDYAHDIVILCPLIPTSLSVDEAAVFLEKISSSFCVRPSLPLMTRFAHCNRIFARSPHCSGAVSRAMHCVLIAASSVQHEEAVLVGLALRCQDANATRNIPHVESTTEAVIGSMWKRALVNKLP